MLDVRAIGAGGGSVAGVEEGGYIYVGPESAGAEPGPACYGLGGERPTVTDADLVLGIIDPDGFLGGKLPLDLDKARAAVRVHVADPLRLTIEEAAAGIKRIVTPAWRIYSGRLPSNKDMMPASLCCTPSAARGLPLHRLLPWTWWKKF